MVLLTLRGAKYDLLSSDLVQKIAQSFTLFFCESSFGTPQHIARFVEQVNPDVLLVVDIEGLSKCAFIYSSLDKNIKGGL